jgi:hypothetical protein
MERPGTGVTIHRTDIHVIPSKARNPYARQIVAGVAIPRFARNDIFVGELCAFNPLAKRPE